MIDKWLRGQLLPWVSSPVLSYLLTGVAFLDELVLEEFNWRTFSMIIQDLDTSRCLQRIGNSLSWLVDLFNKRESENAFPRIFTRFLMDPARLWPFRVNLQIYTNLAKQILKILRDK